MMKVFKLKKPKGVPWRDCMVTGKQVYAIVGHVGIEVSNLSKSKKFYRVLLNKLGFEVVMETEEAFGLSNGNFQVWLSQPQKTRVKREAPTGEEFIVADHLAVLVRDKETVNNVEREMKKNGVEPLFPCEEHPQFEPGYYAVSFCDPDNYVIEIYTRPEPKQF
ncbi:MAG: VOC family protein [Candidatus Bathyarchaeota archaeon]|nr:VOC family protein [Candidatus Bathyarchaeota archaeon]